MSHYFFALLHLHCKFKKEKKPVPKLLFDEYLGEWPSLASVTSSGKVHVSINYLDYCNDQLHIMISSADLYELSKMIGREIEKRYDIAYESIDISQLKGEIAFHVYAYVWLGMDNSHVIDLDIYTDGTVRDQRWYVNFMSSFFQ